jgi:hypothetical protein
MGEVSLARMSASAFVAARVDSDPDTPQSRPGHSFDEPPGGVRAAVVS